ncbi:NAD(P)/FAD-dependent oxidoreductase [Terrabacter aerolatus]|uniref:Monooxygenase n=1 Tax=Terrabacter aerolatus TaxID=422442 RepID=A0A512D0F2_9MICO|nr:monooxygenase [Terrabacter aerolatus]
MRVAIVGAGFAGLGAALRLQAEGEDSFVVLERAPAVGGTWRDNTYPGVRCDVPAHLYCFSFLPNPSFSSRFARGGEIRDYLERAAEPVREHLRLGTNVESAVWSGTGWHLTTSAGPVSADVLVLAAGRLTAPRLPEVPGRFAGPVFHSSAWDHSVDLDGARVAVVGTGASGIQLLPDVAARARSVVVLQRSAPYVLPRGDVAYGAVEQARFAEQPDVLAALRADLFAEAERLYDARVGDLGARQEARARALRHLTDQVGDPALRARLTPRHEFGCKRVLFSDDYYPAAALPHVTVQGPLSSFEPDAVLTDRDRHEVDVVILATGFHTTRQPYAGLVRGRTGSTLDEHWVAGMQAYASTAVHDFPNMYILDGPNASLSHNSAVLMIEAQIDYVLGALRQTPPGVALEVSAAAEDRYAQEMAVRSVGKPWTSGCSNWYTDPRNGRQSLLWPGRATEFRERFATFDLAPYERRTVAAAARDRRGGARHDGPVGAESRGAASHP